MSTAPTRPRRGAFTWIELIIVIGAIAFLTWVILAYSSVYRDAAARVQSQNNLKQMGLALHAVASSHGTRLPPSDGYIGAAAPDKFSGTAFTHMLPYIEQEHLYKAIKRGDVTQGFPPGLDPGVPSLRVEAYIAPTDPTFVSWPATTDAGTTGYGSNAQALGGNGLKIADVTDGLNNTIAFAERYARPSLSAGESPAVHAPHYWVNQLGGPGTQIPSADPKYPASHAYGPTFYTAVGLAQIRPSIADSDEAHASGPRPKIVQVCMLDGSARPVSYGVSLATWQAAHTPNAKDKLGPDW